MKPPPGARMIASPRNLARIVSLTMAILATVVTIKVLGALLKLLDSVEVEQIWYLSWLS